MTPSDGGRAYDMEEIRCALGDMVRSVAAENEALQRLLELEKAADRSVSDGSGCLKDYVGFHESVRSVLKKIAQLQMLSQLRLESLQEFLKLQAAEPDESAGDSAGAEDLEE